ncbi:uncharacterized protein LOC110712920 [Chenopodium quinoa]|uniref:uncharacterized protein LOC110712920 n=1 Tax=Chenopodium quinoa TaxID=63459 RepID=UPI000B76CCD1|nr:uncharacterized protein LOC110712920 [Chenopodium quinoa]
MPTEKTPMEEKAKRQFFPSMDSRMQRYKFVWRVLMVVNLGFGAYIFGMSKKKDGSSKSEKHEEAPPPATSAPTVTSVEKPEYATATPTAELALPAQTSEPAVNFYGQPIVPATPAAVDVLSTDESVEPEYPPVTPIAELVKVHEPITEDQQREIFKWILDEKRKVKPRNRDEKKQIDEEKAMLKQFIRGKSNPSL